MTDNNRHKSHNLTSFNASFYNILCGHSDLVHTAKMQHCHNCCDWLKRPLVTFWKSNKETLGSPPAAVIMAET